MEGFAEVVIELNLVLRTTTPENQNDQAENPIKHRISAQSALPRGERLKGFSRLGGFVFMENTELIALLTKRVKEQEGLLRHLNQLIHLHDAQLTALRVFAIAKIADLEGQDRNAAFDHFQKVIKACYDEHILKIELRNPALAAELDVRPSLSAQEQADWYLADEHFPKTNPPESDETGEKK